MPVDLLLPLGGWLLTYLLHSTLLLGLAALVTSRWVRQAATRDVLWKVALIGGLVTSLVQTGLGFEPVGGLFSLRAGEPSVALDAPSRSAGGWRGVLVAPSTDVPTEAPVGTKSFRRPASVAVPAVPVATPPVSRDEGLPELPTYPATAFLLVAWGVVGGGLATLYLLQRRRAMRRIGTRRPVTDAALLAMLEGLRRDGAVVRRVRLTWAPGIASPVALGRDEIVVPEAALSDLEVEQQRSMLAHELAHLVRRDPTWLTVACLLERAFFLQPLNRVARLRLQEAAEFLCDDWAVRRTGSSVSLATCLVKVAEWVHAAPQPIPLAGMAERRSQLVERIHRLIEGRPMTRAPRTLWLSAIAVTLLGVTAVAAPGITAARTTDTPTATDDARDPASASMDALLAGVPVDTPPPVAVEADSAPTTRWGRLTRTLRQMETRARSDAMRSMVRARSYASAMPALAPASSGPGVWGAMALSSKLDAERLAELGGRRQRDTTSIAVPALIAALKDNDVEVRRAAASSLANLEDPRAVPGLIDALKDSDKEVRVMAANALGNLEDPRAVPGLAALVSDRSSDVRAAALSALDRFPESVPTSAIVTALGDTNEEVRHAALSLASSRLSREDEDGHHTAEPAVVSAVLKLLTDPSADVRQSAVSVLGDAGLTEAPAALFSLRSDRDADVRQSLASALGEIRDPKAVPVLKELLNDTNSDVRESAVNALSEIRDRAALEALIGALKSSDASVRRAAAEALGQRED